MWPAGQSAIQRWMEHRPTGPGTGLINLPPRGVGAEVGGTALASPARRKKSGYQTCGGSPYRFDAAMQAVQTCLPFTLAHR
jgi:hypothetical protein